MIKRVVTPLLGLLLVLTACGDDDAGAGDVSTTGGATTVTTAATTTSEAAPPMGPAEVVVEAQTSDGSSIVVASVTLPSAGFIAVHGDGGGSPGPVIGHSDLLAAGTSTDVVVALDEPLAASGMVFPMAHIDVNGNGEYEFFPPDMTVDGPATKDGGGVAVAGAEITVESASAAPADGAVLTIAQFSFGDPITVAVGETVTVRNEDAAAHTWTSTDGVFDSGRLGGGEEFTFVFDQPGEYRFLCDIHPAAMAGSIVVTG